MRIRRFDIYQTDFPFRSVFRHAKSTRGTSSSVILRCTLDNDVTGYGESLPRSYVTGETVDLVFEILAEKVLPELFECDFGCFAEVESFCQDLYGWLGRRLPGLPDHYGAICCAAELSLLDAFGRHFDRCLIEPGDAGLRYSGVISSGTPLTVLALALRYRAAQVPAVKLKVGVRWDGLNARVCRRVLGGQASLRADANGGWTLEQALEKVPRLQRQGIEHIEQPLTAGDLPGMKRLHESTGAQIIVDEDLRDIHDAERLIEAGACQGFNIRVSKCGGFYQSLRIAELARLHGLFVQVGCQVGETALLSAAGLALAQRIRRVRFLEGFFGTYLLREDVLPAGEDGKTPILRFGRKGIPPACQWQPGLGVPVDWRLVERYATRSRSVERK